MSIDFERIRNLREDSFLISCSVRSIGNLVKIGLSFELHGIRQQMFLVFQLNRGFRRK